MPVTCQKDKYEMERTKGLVTTNGQPDHHPPALDDEYPIDHLEQEAMSLLITAPACVYEGHMPPSSVTNAWDHASQSVEEYDETLQHSSPVLSETRQDDAKKESLAVTYNQDLLDEDVDWEAVVAATSTIPKYSSTTPSRESKAPQQDVQEAQECSNVEAHPPSDRPSPFVRPPFPEKVRGRCPVPGLSSETVLRTCFRVGVMINQTLRCFSHQQRVVFELFARVVYSNRETLSRKQHFQFVDLFKDRQPFPSGVLAGWKAGSQLDKHSSAFLNTNAGPKLCWCLCRPVKDPRAAIGWSYIVLAIEETSWDRVEWSKRTVCGAFDEA